MDIVFVVILSVISPSMFALGSYMTYRIITRGVAISSAPPKKTVILNTPAREADIERRASGKAQNPSSRQI